MQRVTILKAIFLGLVSSMFLSTGLVVNSLNTFHGESWAWTACLRFLLLLPVLILLVSLRGRLIELINVIKVIPYTFLIWGNLGFGCFYAALSFATKFAPGWLVSAGFMTTVLVGIVISPLIYDDNRAVISKKALALSSILVTSLFIMQFDQLSSLHQSYKMAFSLGLTLLAAVLWPLGNRKLMLKLEDENIKLDPMQRVLGMTIGSIPTLTALALYGYISVGFPTEMQMETSFIAVLFAGVLGSVLFYKAMQMVERNHIALLTVEATQVTCVLFTLLGEMIFKGTRWPGIYGNIGFGLMCISLGAYTWISMQRPRLFT
jgi:hypothetical protein